MRKFLWLFSLIGICIFHSLIAAADEPTIVLSGQCEPEMAPHGQGNVYAPDVMLDGGVFRIWYGGQGKDGHDRISYAESPDGKNWNRKGVVLKDDKANHVNDPSVVKFKGRYFLFYTRTERDVVDRIDLAISEDGITWTPNGASLAPGPEGTWDRLSVGRPSVILEGGLFKMWYDGRKDFPPGTPVKGVPISSTSQRSVGFATSTDGVTWAKHRNNPVYENDAGAVDVKHVLNTYLMLYESQDGTLFATSIDGIEWKDCGMFVKKSNSQIDAFGHVTPFLLLDPGKSHHRLFVGAASASTWDRNRIAVFEFDGEHLNQFLRKAD